MREVELKLELQTADVDRFLSASVLADLVVRLHAQTSTYFDSPNRAVRKAGLSLRIRAVGEQRIQTVKAESASAAGLFSRPEWEMPVQNDWPVIDTADEPFRSLVPAGDLPQLQPIFEIAVSRQTRDIEWNGAKIELVLDQGEIVAGSRTATICEVELELKQGTPKAIFALARSLDAVSPLRLSALSKAQRGYKLLQGNIDGPVNWTPLSFTSDMASAEGYEAIAHACIRHFHLNQAILLRTDSSEALHQARVALRRLRSALSIFKAMLGDDQFAHLKSELRWITRQLDAARNLDVLLERLSDETVKVPLLLARKRAYATATFALASPRSRTLMLDLLEWTTIGEWRTRRAAKIVDQRLDRFAAGALHKHRRRVTQHGRHWGRLDDKARHRLRIEAKKLRYAADFFGPLFPGSKALRRQKAFGHALRALQTSLGDLNDQSTGAALLFDLGFLENTSNSVAARRLRERELLLQEAAKAFVFWVDAKSFWQ